MRVLKLSCPECHSSAIIKKTSWKHVHLADMYCACDNVECGHTWVSNVTFSHTLSPSGLTGSRLVSELLKRLKPDEKQMALDLLQGQMA